MRQNVTSANQHYRASRDARRAQLRDAHAPLDLGHLETIVTVQDGASHSLAFPGSVWGVPVVPLGVDEFGQSGSRVSTGGLPDGRDRRGPDLQRRVAGA